MEGHLFENQQVYELLDGCICCTIQDDLKETMNELIIEMEQRPLDVLLIEGTGVANPMEIQEVLLSHPYIEQFDLMSIITVLDASHYLEYQSIFSSSTEVRNLMHEQMICGSLLVLNKTDLVPSNQLENIKQRITNKLQQEKTIIECMYGKVDAELLFEKRIHSVLIGKSSLDSEHHHHHSSLQALKLEDIPVVKRKNLKNGSNIFQPMYYEEKGLLESKALINFTVFNMHQGR